METTEHKPFDSVSAVDFIYPFEKGKYGPSNRASVTLNLIVLAGYLAAFYLNTHRFEFLLGILLSLFPTAVFLTLFLDKPHTVLSSIGLALVPVVLFLGGYKGGFSLQQLIFTETLLLSTVASIFFFREQIVSKCRYAREVYIKFFQTAKFGDLGEVVAGVAHEISNPVTIIHGKAKLMEYGAEESRLDAEEIIQVSEQIRRAAERISSVISSLKVYAEEASDEPFQVVQADTIIPLVLKFFEARARKHGIEIRATNFDVGDCLECRRGELIHVLVVLLSNSFDAVKGLNEKWITIEPVFARSGVEIWVTDSGKGISSENADRIMNPFFTTKPAGKGTGLGLCVSKAIVESHGGTLTLDRTCANTRFVIWLPGFVRNQQKTVA